MRYWFFTLTVCLSLVTTLSFGQTTGSNPDTTDIKSTPIHLNISSHLLAGSSNQLPFWLHTNRLGTVDPNSANFLNRIRATGDLYQTEIFKLDYGADLTLRVSENSTAFFPELYAGAEYRAFRLDFGRFDRPIGLNNHDLSIGSMMVSRNAVPIPRIMVSTPNFTDVPFTGEILEFKAMFSNGWFTDERFTENPYLHQKYLYLKFNFEPVSVIGGIIHNVQWGGTHPDFGITPQSFSDFLKVVFSQSADPGDNVSSGQITNRLGNTVAAYEFGISRSTNSYNLSVTRLFYLEDTVSSRLRSPWDGVWGFNLEFADGKRLLNAITYEHINTRQQDAKADQELGRADYYNHHFYRSGWSYYNRTLGLPLITRNQETDRVNNNIIVGHHLGVNGQLSANLDYKLLATYTRNYGTGIGFHKEPRGSINFAERRQDQYSVLLDLNYSPETISRITFNLATAIDFGEFREKSVGGSLGVRYIFD